MMAQRKDACETARNAWQQFKGGHNNTLVRMDGDVRAAVLYKATQSSMCGSRCCRMMGYSDEPVIGYRAHVLVSVPLIIWCFTGTE
jgi:hypothetical protein